jgi:uncharacterized membrane protein YraQ (UPF0718 family)
VRNLKLHSISGSLQTVLLLFPCWLILFYFKESISRWLIYKVFSFAHGESMSNALVFFITTFLKIYLLLVLIVFIMALVRSWLPAYKFRDRLKSMPLLPANICAGLFGILTPFCSCSAIPMFIGFLETGIPLGITFTFLIASPLVNEVILAMLAGLFGIKVAVIYLIAGLTVAIGAGFIIGRLQLERYLPEWLLTFRNEKMSQNLSVSLNTRVSIAIENVREVLARTWIYVLAGIVLGAAIHGYVPDDLLSRVLGKDAWYSLPMAVLTGIPLYACSASVAPVAFALVDKGMPLGTALAFTMAVAGLSLPEFVMLKKVLSTRLILIFAGTVFVGILLVGYFFNWIL